MRLKATNPHRLPSRNRFMKFQSTANFSTIEEPKKAAESNLFYMKFQRISNSSTNKEQKRATELNSFFTKFQRAANLSTNEEPKKAAESNVLRRDKRENLLHENMKSVYVHPLSQIVLQHFQEKFHPFLTITGLDRGLSINEDGTLLIRFPCSTEEKAEENNRIWTTYEPEERKHWLSVKKGDIVERFMLQDDMRPAWHSSASSTPAKVQNAVDELVATLEYELKKESRQKLNHKNGETMGDTSTFKNIVRPRVWSGKRLVE